MNLLVSVIMHVACLSLGWMLAAWWDQLAERNERRQRHKSNM